eukprot:1157419-Pelagomonas_calceolata.AAC.17
MRFCLVIFSSHTIAGPEGAQCTQGLFPSPVAARPVGQCCLLASACVCKCACALLVSWRFQPALPGVFKVTARQLSSLCCYLSSNFCLPLKH